MREAHEDGAGRLTRREVLGLMAAAAAFPAGAGAASGMLSRPIPSTGETIPAIGLGTWRVFDVGGSPSERAPLTDVLRNLAAVGGRVVHASPISRTAATAVGA